MCCCDKELDSSCLDLDLNLFCHLKCVACAKYAPTEGINGEENNEDVVQVKYPSKGGDAKYQKDQLDCGLFERFLETIL